ncbi:DUF6646 family protein [Maribacter sp. 2307ULW6-5]|uniref:DUF6646 family protein n=1 Tax=Maribacter sp. 2307ULW6-5 TaxID=3386275 RepID=UPI0039BD715E
MKTMKLYLFFVAAMLGSAWTATGQAFDGKGDVKFQLGANFQENGSGIVASYDYGVGPNLSVGVWSSYVLGVKESLNADFTERFDLRVRLNANLANVIDNGGNFDLYPGLSLGLKNFGGHLGARYFFSDGFGVYTEIGAPIARYKTDIVSPAEELLNQFLFSLGVSFNL